MANDRAKEVAARQKAEAKALRESKKHSDDPKDWGTIRQIRETIKMTVQEDPASKWWLLLALIGPIILGVVAGVVLKSYIYWPILGILVGMSLGMVALLQLSKSAMYKKYDGKPGSAQVALGMLDKKKWTSSIGIAGTRQQDAVHRLLGPAGIVLVGDGDEARVKGLLATERKRHEQVAYDVPVSTISVGRGKGQVPLDKAASAIKKLPKTLTKADRAQLDKRIKALDNVRGMVPLPKGPMPNLKGARKAMRGH